MDRRLSPVRSHVSERRQRARATHRRIIDAAHRLFAEGGYPSTTMDAIADAAGVAVQTVYHVFHTKSDLLKEVIQVASTGEPDQTPVLVSSWMQEAMVTTDGRRALALTIEHGIDISARVAPLIGAINAATSTDPEFADYWDVSCEVRRTGTAQVVSVIAANGQLRSGLDPQRAADITYAIGSHETLLAFLRDCRWSLEEVKAWYYMTLCDQLLSEEARKAPGPGSRSPTDGLSFDHLVRFT